MNKYDLHTYSYLELRKSVGWIGILLPFFLMFGWYLFFDGQIVHQSISHYYHTPMRNLFVGTLCAVALFMFFYSGYDKWDNWLGNCAGICALGVAFFPATESGPSDTVGIVHFISASLFFTFLAIFSYFQFTKSNKIPEGRKLTRNRIYKACGALMFSCLLIIAVYMNFFEKSHPIQGFVFWFETLALIAFGISWLTKGGSLYPDIEQA